LSLVKGGSIAANPTQISHLPPGQRAVFVEAFSHALQAVFLVAVPFTVLAFVLSMVMKEIPLRTTSQISQANPGTAENDPSGTETADADPPDMGGDGVLGAVNLVVGVPDL
jgi:hypothetical protein